MAQGRGRAEPGCLCRHVRRGSFRGPGPKAREPSVFSGLESLTPTTFRTTGSPVPGHGVARQPCKDSRCPRPCVAPGVGTEAAEAAAEQPALHLWVLSPMVTSLAVAVCSGVSRGHTAGCHTGTRVNTAGLLIRSEWIRARGFSVFASSGVSIGRKALELWGPPAA